MQTLLPIPNGEHALQEYTEEILNVEEITQWHLVEVHHSGEFDYTHTLQGAWRSFQKPNDQSPDYTLYTGYLIQHGDTQVHCIHRITITPELRIKIESQYRCPEYPSSNPIPKLTPLLIFRPSTYRPESPSSS